MLAREVGASWDEVLGSILLTLPRLRAAARGRGDPARARGFDAAPSRKRTPTDDDDPDR